MSKIKKVVPRLPEADVEDFLSYDGLMDDLDEVITFLPKNSFLRRRIVTCAEIINEATQAILNQYEDSQHNLETIEEMLR
jgi:hypothetical protein